MNGMMFKEMIYDSGWLGDIKGYKYVFPDAPIPADNPNGNFLWYESIKNGCSLNDGCGYNYDSIKNSGDKIASVIENEKNLLNAPNYKNIFLGGYSQGG